MKLSKFIVLNAFHSIFRSNSFGISGGCTSAFPSEPLFFGFALYFALLVMLVIFPMLDIFYCCLQIKDGFGDGKDLVVTVMSAMGEEQICALKDIGPK